LARQPGAPGAEKPSSSLSTKEFALLELMLRRRGEALSRGQLLEGAWELGFESRSNLVDVYVRYLRDKKGDEVALHVLDSGPGLPEHFAAPTGRGARAGPAWGWQSSI